MGTQDEEIRARAYQIWDEEGRPEGREREHWLQACRELGVSEADSGSTQDGGTGTASDPDLPGSPGTASNGFEDAAAPASAQRKPRAASARA